MVFLDSARVFYLSQHFDHRAAKFFEYARIIENRRNKAHKAQRRTKSTINMDGQDMQDKEQAGNKHEAHKARTETAIHMSGRMV